MEVLLTLVENVAGVDPIAILQSIFNESFSLQYVCFFFIEVGQSGTLIDHIIISKINMILRSLQAPFIYFSL